MGQLFGYAWAPMALSLHPISTKLGSMHMVPLTPLRQMQDSIKRILWFLMNSFKTWQVVSHW